MNTLFKDLPWSVSFSYGKALQKTTIVTWATSGPVSGLGGKVGMDATNKWKGETDREWGRPIRMDDAVRQRVDALWDELGID